jgi:signal transduction histidine kinase
VFKSLQARLTLSYVVIIVVCLALIGLAALVLLRNYQRELTYRRLMDRSKLAAQVTAAALGRGTRPRLALQRLGQQLNQGQDPPVFVYLLDSEGRVVAGSNDRLQGQQFEQLALHPGSPLPEPMRGERRLATGERLLFVAEPVPPPDGEGRGETPYILVLGQAYRPVQLALGDLLPRLIWAGAIALGLSIVLAALMAYSIARPLERISRAAEEVAAGEYEQQLDITSPSEVARLAASFNSMASQVNATLQSQQDLIANVSHELKTPLTSIQGFSQALLDGTAGDEVARQRAATIVHEEAGRMRHLVDDLLDLARLEGRQVAFAREAVDIEALLQGSLDRFEPASQVAGVQLDIKISSDLPVVVGDAERLNQVFDNLLDNALKYARSANDGRVVLLCEPRENSVLCSVTDNGPGIPPEEVPRIFERFYQVDKSRACQGRSVGLGLAIAQEIVEAHEGRIWVDSVEGLGTRFNVELPARRA